MDDPIHTYLHCRQCLALPPAHRIELRDHLHGAARELPREIVPGRGWREARAVGSEAWKRAGSTFVPPIVASWARMAPRCRVATRG
jgi:hypothetical protein